MKIILKEEIYLTEKEIDDISEKFAEILSEVLSKKKKEQIRIRLSFEEILLNWKEKYYGEKVSLRIEKRRGKLTCILECKTKDSIEANPLIVEKDEFGESIMATGILSNLGVIWNHQYEDGVNHVETHIRYHKVNQITLILGAIVLAMLTVAMLSILPISVREECLTFVIEPLFSTFMKMLTAVVGPMMFLTVIGGIMSIGDPKQLGVFGKKICGKYILENVYSALFGVILILSFFDIQYQKVGNNQNQVQFFVDMVMDIVPNDIVTPFTSGNTMQIIFMAIIVGGFMLSLQNQVHTVCKLVDQMNLVIQGILAALSKLIPGFVYLSITRMGLVGEFAGLESFMKMIILYILASIFLILARIIIAAKKVKMPIKKLIKILFPSYIISITTASSAAVYGECVENCIHKLGISKKLTDFGLPLGTVICMPDFSIWLVLLGGAYFEYSQISVPINNIIILMITAVFLAIAAPPIPGGAMCCYALLFAQLGIPSSFLAIAGAINLVTDFVGTGGHMIAGQVELLIAASELKRIKEQ